MISDPAVIAIHAEIKASFTRMDEGFETLLAYPASVKFRVDGAMQRQVRAWMKRHNIHNQAEALRRLLAAGLEGSQ